MDWNDSCLHIYQFIVMMLNHLHSNLMLTFSIPLLSLKIRQFPGTLAFSRDSYFSTEQRTRFCIPTYKLLKLAVSCHTGKLVLHLT